MQRRSRRVTQEEVALWRRATRDVVERHAADGVGAKKTLEPPADPPSEPPGATPSVGPPTAKPQPAKQPRRNWTPAPIDARLRKRLRRGLILPEARLDLHGHTQATAHAALLGFLSRSRSRRLRCVLVITGKGRETGGVLKEAVPRWLHETAFARHVVGSCEAGPRDGGDGALYILLRRPA